MISDEVKRTIGSGKVFIIALDADYYGSDGEEALAYAMGLFKPIIIIRPKTSQVPAPKVLDSYYGKKALIVTEGDEDPMTEAMQTQVKDILEEWGISYTEMVELYDIGWKPLDGE